MKRALKIAQQFQAGWSVTSLAVIHYRRLPPAVGVEKVERALRLALRPQKARE